MAKKKSVKKEEEFKKLVDEEELDEYEEYDDESNYSNYNVTNSEFDLKTEINALKILACISICITVVCLLVTLVVLSKVTGTSSYNVSGSGTGTGTDSSGTGVQEEVEYDTSMFTEITFDEFKSLWKDGKKAVVYTGRSTCGYCVAFLPYLQQSVKDYDYTLYYLDVDKLNNDNFEYIAELDEEFADTIGATPMVYVIKDKKVAGVNEGYTDYDTYAKFLEKNDIKEK